ncbi:hypothetical protein IFM89_031924 [Coptis chinensis]|uniref:Receptor-like serine/threonine-protein kinase n=1 Tax=Coptis chinensis TaxID=261450 RepID=A0A835IP25_9MAGN|nr:hypothetical protein IFM89_031924 [Coptis chinensis]
MESSYSSLSYFVFLILFSLVSIQVTCELPTSIFPNFTGTNTQHIDNSGAFLISSNGTYRAAITNPASQMTSFYLSVIHVASNSIIWVANRDSPITHTNEVRLTVNGLSIFDSNRDLVWSTLPSTAGVVSRMQLMENGNLVLLDKYDNFVWQSFDHPANTIAVGQVLPVGMKLISPISDSNFSEGEYQLLVIENDAVLQWKGQNYWTLSSSLSRETMNYSGGNSYMRINKSGLYISNDSSNRMPPSVGFITLDYSGQLKFLSFSGMESQRFDVEPTGNCLLPFSCGHLGLCSDMVNTNSHACSCSVGLDYSNSTDPLSGCLLPNGSKPPFCTTISSVSYVKLDASIQYFANNFKPPSVSGISQHVCQDRCSRDCSCMGFFYTNSSSKCYLLKEPLGSLTRGRNQNALGYLKFVDNSLQPAEHEVGGKRKRVLLPTFAWFLLSSLAILFVAAFFGLRYGYRRKLEQTKIVSHTSHKTGSLSALATESLCVSAYIPGLPVRFSYNDIETATNNFNNQIGSGGFGVVYKGTSPLDNSEVAVKKISSIAIEGKKGFCAEITAIGLIHHVNLVKLRGFCTRGLDHFLVYEFMNRGSLDNLLFGTETILDWSERVEIALGTARGLAYLHGDCENKILHLDVKPANILVGNPFQVKLADFGLSKLLGPEQSKLFTTMRGTRGYLAPEWLTSNTGISDKSDVYSFGMVLLEIIRGSRNCLVIKGKNIGESTWTYFPKMALEKYKHGLFTELADPRLEGRVKYEQVEMLVKIALCCLHNDPWLRPSMVNVVRMIEGKMAVGVPQVNSLKFLNCYGRQSIDHNMTDSSAKDAMPPFSYLSSEQLSGPR